MIIRKKTLLLMVIAVLTIGIFGIMRCNESVRFGNPKSKHETELRQIYMALCSYYTDNNGAWPDAFQDTKEYGIDQVQIDGWNAVYTIIKNASVLAENKVPINKYYKWTLLSNGTVVLINNHKL